MSGPAIELVSPVQHQLRAYEFKALAVEAAILDGRLSALGPAAFAGRGRTLWPALRPLRRSGWNTTIVGPGGQVIFGEDDREVQRMVRTGKLPPSNGERRSVLDFGRYGSWARVVRTVATRAGVLAVAVYGSLGQAESVRHELVTGILRAGAVSLLVSLLLGFLLSGGLLRRTRRLRDAALRIAARGPGIEPPKDRGRDEIGDLSRAFARMQRRLSDQEQAREAFVATASHELRTPIGALQMRLGLLSEDLERDHVDLADVRDQIDRAAVQAERLGKLASELLDLSRLDAELPLRDESVALSSLCRAVASSLQSDASAPIAVREEDPAIAAGDAGKIEQIVAIMLDNARAYAPAGSVVRLIVAGTTVVVEDDGPGVPADEHELIFQRFQRGSGSLDQPGFGLGLAIGRELARRMGGDLRLCGSGPTRFELTLLPDAAGDRREAASRRVESQSLAPETDGSRHPAG